MAIGRFNSNIDGGNLTQQTHIDDSVFAIGRSGMAATAVDGYDGRMGAVAILLTACKAGAVSRSLVQQNQIQIEW